MIRQTRLAVAPVALAALLAACGGPAADNSADAGNAAAASAGATAQAVENLPEGQRTAVFLRAIRDAGQDCQTVSSARKVSAAGAPPTWQVTCENGGDWIVAFAAGGTATVTDRAAYEARGAQAN